MSKKTRRLTRRHRGGEWAPAAHNLDVRRLKAVRRALSTSLVGAFIALDRVTRAEERARAAAAALFTPTPDPDAPCGDEVHSWDIDSPDERDAYWAHCTLPATHIADGEDHYDHHNRLTWRTAP